MASIRPDFHESLAYRMVEDVFYHRTNLFYFIGKVDPWREYVDNAVVQDQCDCLCPTCANKNGTLISVQYGDNYEPESDPDNSGSSDIGIRDNIIYVHKLESGDIANVVKCDKWVEGNYYAQWDNTKDMTVIDTPFYVYNSKFEVFKCLFNNKKILGDDSYELTPSTVEPSGVNYDVTYTSDGYVWKYLYTIPTALKNKFMSHGFVPVITSLSSTFYSRGAIDEIIVVDGGEGYSSEYKTFAEIDPPDGENGVQAKITLFVNDRSGTIDSYVIDEKGSGYTKTPEIVVRDLQGDGTGKYGNTTAILKANIVDGSLDSVTIVDPGINYSGDTATTITVSGDGHGCVAYPRIVDGKIVGVIVAEPGDEYTYATVKASCAVNAADIRPAKFETKIGGSININNQSIIQQIATEGSIYAIELTTGGYDYTDGTEVIIEGDGTGCVAHTEVENGRISRVIVDKFGEGYTYAKISFFDKNRKEPNENPEAQAYAILPPLGGHGCNPIKELNSSTVCTCIMVDSAKLTKFNQEFRQSGIVQNLLALETHTIVQDTDSMIAFEIYLDTTTNITDALGEDSIVKIDNVLYRVIWRDNNHFFLQQLSYIFREIQEGALMNFTDEKNAKDYTYTVSEVVDRPHVNKYSGEVLYINNNSPYELVDNQRVKMRTYIEF